jgi:hypothetical protein
VSSRIPVVGDERREGPRRKRAGRPLQGGTGGPPPGLKVACQKSWLSAKRVALRIVRVRKGWLWPNPVSDAYRSGAVRWVSPDGRVFLPRAPPPFLSKAARGAGPPSGGRVEPRLLLSLGARGRVPRVSSGPATMRRPRKRPPREGP